MRESLNPCEEKPHGHPGLALASTLLSSNDPWPPDLGAILFRALEGPWAGRMDHQPCEQVHSKVGVISGRAARAAVVPNPKRAKPWS
jgi:hypothetical protein